MDPINNPYSPGAGSPPPELVGREGVLQDARILLGRVLAKRSEKSIVLVGQRGVGKTVLLNEIRYMAEALQYRVASIEAAEDRSFAAAIAPSLRELYHELNRMAGVGDKVKDYLAVLRSFLGTVKFSASDYAIEFGVCPDRGPADSGNLENDLTAVLIALAEAAQARNTGIALIIDELQTVDQVALGALIASMHKMQQRQLPLVLIAAGLPALPGRAGEAKSYAERLFNYPTIGPLTKEDTARALKDPAKALGVTFEDDALQYVYRMTQGYPYFVQEWGYQAWNLAEKSPITRQVIESATALVVARLDQNFFRVRFDRLAPSEKNFLRAMAINGPGPCRSGDIAELLKVKGSSLSPLRAKLIQKGMIYSPSYGELAFTVPLFDEFMIRAMPDFQA